MTKVITYGTYDLLHYGHIRLLERAKSLGDYLIVGVTGDDFDKKRGKINVQQSLVERIEAVRATGLADEIIVEEYEGQKIDDIKRYGIDIFTVGSDWVGKFDYLNEYCKVVYLDRTQGVSSTELRSEKKSVKLGIVGDSQFIEKYIAESKFVNGLNIYSMCTNNKNLIDLAKTENIKVCDNFESLLVDVDAVYIASMPQKHYSYIKEALLKGKHVLYESPMTLSIKECEELFALAKSKSLILTEAIKTAYSTAFSRLILLVKSGLIGDVVSIDVTCTSLKEFKEMSKEELLTKQNSMCAWGTTALLPVLMLLGSEFKRLDFVSSFLDKDKRFDIYTKINMVYPSATATINVGKGIKSEGDLVISGTDGYVYVPAPWWKTDYFEIRNEDITQNKRYFYQLDGEGIRYELVAFVNSINTKKSMSYISEHISKSIVSIIEKFNNKENLIELDIKE